MIEVKPNWLRHNGIKQVLLGHQHLVKNEKIRITGRTLV